MAEQFTRFVTLALGDDYLGMAETLVHSLKEHFRGPHGVSVYARGPARRRGPPTFACDLPADGFSKLPVLAAECREHPNDLIVYVDADMRAVAPLSRADLDPGAANLFCVRHFLPQHENLWGVGPRCMAYRPRRRWGPCYWQTCLFGGYACPLSDLLHTCSEVVRMDRFKQGAWEEPYLCALFADAHHEIHPIHTLGCEFACPVWRDGQPADHKALYEQASEGRPARFLHENFSHRAG